MRRLCPPSSLPAAERIARSVQVDGELQHEAGVAEQIDLEGERAGELPSEGGDDSGRKTVDVERNLVLVLALVAVEQANRPFGVQRVPSAPPVEPLAAERVSARLA